MTVFIGIPAHAVAFFIGIPAHAVAFFIGIPAFAMTLAFTGLLFVRLGVVI